MRPLPDAAARRARLSKKRAVRRIRLEHDRQAAAIRTPLPGLRRGPKFYLAAIVLFVILAAALFRSADSARVRKAASRSPLFRAARSVDVLAEALGRYRFHTGRYPAPGQGLRALVRDPGDAPGWGGPYINLLRNDPWGMPYGYAPPAAPDGRPRLFSRGPDRREGTADDILPDASRFDPGPEWTAAQNKGADG